MSSELVEQVRRANEHFARTGEPLWETLDPDIEVHDHDIPDAGTYRGHSGVARWLEDWSQSWQSFELEYQDVVGEGDQVVFLFLLRATGRGSGVPVERPDAIRYTMRDGLTVRLDYYNDQSEALAAAGLSVPRSGR